MFLTKMPLNPRRRAARSLLSSPQALHAAVLAGFSDPSPNDEGRVLWRLDTYDQHRVVLFTASPGKPDFTHLVEQVGWPTTEAWDTRPYDGLLESLRLGQQWQFRLAGNTVHSGRRESWSDTKPIGHVTVDQQQRWLLDRAQRCGFRIAETTAGVEEPVPDCRVVERGTRRFNRQGARVTITTATFEGRLEITDVSAFRHSLTFGIGRAKAYGCGLLTIAKPAARA